MAKVDNFSKYLFTEKSSNTEYTSEKKDLLTQEIFSYFRKCVLASRTFLFSIQIGSSENFLGAENLFFCVIAKHL